MNKAVRYTTSPEVTYTKIDEGEAVLLHLGTQRYFTLNETGVAIWELLAAPRSVGEISAALAEAFEGERDELEAAVTRFVQSLRSDDLIHAV